MSQPKAVLAELLHIKLPFSNWEEGGCDLRRSDSSCQWTLGLTLHPGGERARRARRPGVSTPQETSLRTATSLSWGQEPPFGAPRHGTPIPGLSLPVLWAAGATGLRDPGEGHTQGLWAWGFSELWVPDREQVMESRSVVSYSLLPSMEFSRPEYWVTFPFPRGSPQPRDQTQVSRTAGRFFTS